MSGGCSRHPGDSWPDVLREGEEAPSLFARPIGCLFACHLHASILQMSQNDAVSRRLRIREELDFADQEAVLMVFVVCDPMQELWVRFDWTGEGSYPASDIIDLTKD